MSILMNIKRISQVFSRRAKTNLVSLPAISQATRIRIIQYFLNSFRPNDASFYEDNSVYILSTDIREKLLFVLGRHQLDLRNPVTYLDGKSATDDLFQFLHQCSDDSFFDFVELIFPTYNENYQRKT